MYQQSRRYDLQFEIGVWQTEIGNFGSFFALSPTKTPEKLEFWKKKKKMQEISCYTCVPKTTMIWWMASEIQSDTDRFLCHFKSLFALLPSNNLQNQNFEKTKHTSGDKIILCMCTKNFTPLTIWKIKIFKKWKKYLEKSSFYTWVPHVNHFTDCILYCSRVMVLDVCFFFHFGLFLPFYHPNSPKN